MDFLDPQKERRNRVALVAGYGLIGLAIAIASIMLLYQTDGYCVDSRGSVDRCGLVFVASQPSGAEVTIDSKVQQARTNTKFNLRTGTYRFKVSQSGYQIWERQVAVEGGDVQRFDYPLLIPTDLRSSEIDSLGTSPYLMTQSPDKRWIVSAEANNQSTVFRLYDIRQTPEPAKTTLDIPTDVLSSASADTSQQWEAVEWSSNNRHVLLLHTYRAPDAATQGLSHEYVLLDRQNPTLSRNVTRELAVPSQEKLSLFDKKPTLFYAYNTEAKTLRTLALSGSPPVTTELQRIEAFKTDADDSILYVTDTPPTGTVKSGTVSVVLQRGEQVRVIRQLPVSEAGYLLDMAKYDGEWYVLIGAKNGKGLYLYRNPIDQPLQKPTAFPTPLRFLRLSTPEYIAFSSTAQFVLVQQSDQVLVYDIKNTQTYRYTAGFMLDAPKKHLQWLDGHRLTGVSGGKGFLVEYDNINARSLVATDPGQGSFFTPDFRRLITLQTQPTGGAKLFMTGLVLQN